MFTKWYLQTEVLVSLAILTTSYYFLDFGIGDVDKVFITITTFFFAIFIGFFLSRQGARYSKIREIISTFDGKMSGIYRVASNVHPEVFAQMGEIIKQHYLKMLETKSWDYHFTHPSNTISAIHKVLEGKIGDAKQESLRNQAIGRILAGLGDCQTLRKNMVMLYAERISGFQWFLITLFVLVLFAAVSIIPSTSFFLGSLLKAGFIVSIACTVVILHQLDDLSLFESLIGEHSAQDVIDIIEGKK